ncbi:MAG: hypothetical protein L3J53_02215 [Proteobacteria bacterium]|nr:hypothetical protein [Pseudomonadota bacterium]
MIKIKANQWFDLNRVGLLATLFMIFVVLFFNLLLMYKFFLILCLIIYTYYLRGKIKQNNNITIMVNAEDHWFVYNGETTQVTVKDYWLLNDKIFIWLNGTNKSISLVVSRSIIGEKLFSQLLSKIL